MLGPRTRWVLSASSHLFVSLDAILKKTCNLSITRIYSILCPAGIRTIEQKCLAGNFNRPFCSTTYCDAHCECVKHRSCPLLHRFISEQVQFVYISPKVLPSPFNCSGSTSLSPTLSLRCVHWRKFSLTTPTNICTPFSGAQKPVCWIMRLLLTFFTVACRCSGITACRRAHRDWYHLVVHLPVISHSENQQLKQQNCQFCPSRQWRVVI